MRGFPNARTLIKFQAQIIAVLLSFLPDSYKLPMRKVGQILFQFHRWVINTGGPTITADYEDDYVEVWGWGVMATQRDT